MKLAAWMMPLFLIACTSTPSDNSLCSITEKPRADHAQGLIDDGGPVSRRTGLVLIEVIEGVC